MNVLAYLVIWGGWLWLASLILWLACRAKPRRRSSTFRLKSR